MIYSDTEDGRKKEEKRRKERRKTMIYIIHPRSERIRFLQLTTDGGPREGAYLVGIQSFRYDKERKFRIAGVVDQPSSCKVKEWVFDGWFEGRDNAASIDMMLNTELVSGSVQVPKISHKIMSVSIHGGVPVHHFDSSTLTFESGLMWKNGIRFENIPVVFSSNDVLFFDGALASVLRFRLLDHEEAGQLVDYCKLRAKHITEKEMLHKLDEIEENYTRWYYERLEERKEWAIEHRCKIDDVIDIEIDDFDRLLHGFPFVDGDELMFAELTSSRSSN